MTNNDLKVLRKHLGLTQREMAEKIGISPRAYFGLEQSSDNIRKIHKLAVIGFLSERENGDWYYYWSHYQRWYPNDMDK